MEDIFNVFKEMEKLSMNPDDFIEFVHKHKVKPKKIRQYEQEYVKLKQKK